MKKPTESEIISQAMKLLSQRRTKAQRKGGRPRGANRCACGKYTLHTSTLRKHKCEKLSENNPETPVDKTAAV